MFEFRLTILRESDSVLIQSAHVYCGRQRMRMCCANAARETYKIARIFQFGLCLSAISTGSSLKHIKRQSLKNKHYIYI